MAILTKDELIELYAITKNTVLNQIYPYLLSDTLDTAIIDQIITSSAEIQAIDEFSETIKANISNRSVQELTASELIDIYKNSRYQYVISMYKAIAAGDEIPENITNIVTIYSGKIKGIKLFADTVRSFIESKT